MSYFEHLKVNWKVSLHSFSDMLIHFIHGLLPFIEIKHYEYKGEINMLKENNSLDQACEIFEKLKINDFKNFEGLDDLINVLSGTVDAEVNQAILDRDTEKVYRDLHDGCDTCREFIIYGCRWNRPANSCPKK
jgi:HPt (histidine-containing phosphotransfer) domain-containing protein